MVEEQKTKQEFPINAPILTKGDPVAKKRGITKVDIFIGERVKEVRKRLGLTQLQVSAILGITFQQLQKYEQGVNRISATMLWSIANIFQIDIKYFFSFSSEENEKGSIKEKGRLFGFNINNNISQKEWSDLQKNYGNIKDPLIRKKISSLIIALQSDNTNSGSNESRGDSSES